MQMSPRRMGTWSERRGAEQILSRFGAITSPKSPLGMSGQGTLRSSSDVRRPGAWGPRYGMAMELIQDDDRTCGGKEGQELGAKGYNE